MNNPPVAQIFSPKSGDEFRNDEFNNTFGRIIYIEGSYSIGWFR